MPAKHPIGSTVTYVRNGRTRTATVGRPSGKLIRRISR